MFSMMGGYVDVQRISHTYCCNGPAALGLSAVVIRRMIVKMLFVFLFSETLSK